MLAGGSGLAVMLRGLGADTSQGSQGSAQPSPRHLAGPSRCLAWQVECFTCSNILASSNFQCKLLGMQRGLIDSAVSQTWKRRLSGQDEELVLQALPSLQACRHSQNKIESIRWGKLYEITESRKRLHDS
ncbi:hypothetical protein DUI87_22958 [Hirundo rustica rustica]|uniref:Uncharacterized protein n=1 Tax=Hirundo rustica rustica TaxID=333673 RepID=A0A3M0JNQ1_HIRRU|nr:hypothetical protein DUI87_22958 [Hirundo rustica rustica]